MATKDWKRTPGKNPKLMQWYNEKTGKSVFVHYQEYYKPVWGKNKKNHWVFEVGTSSKTYLEKNICAV